MCQQFIQVYFIASAGLSVFENRLAEPNIVYIMHVQTSAYIGERQREHGERIITVSRPVRDAELETKSVSRSDRLMQNTPPVPCLSALLLFSLIVLVLR